MVDAPTRGRLVSQYQLQKLVYDYLHEAGTASERPPLSTDGYELTGEERAAVEAADIRGLYQLGLHPVLVNAFARAMGYQRDDYAKMLSDLEREPEVTPRWRSS
jgi:hypothetical protein